MWPASPCIPHTQFTTTNPAAMSLLITAPAPLTAVKPAANRLSTGGPTKFQLYSQLRDIEENKQRQGGAREEQVVVEKRGDSKKLSGFDVLRALEKATAQKMKKRRSGRDGSLLSSRKVSGQGRKARAQEDEEALGDYGDKIVRPFSVKEDWGSRLDELETRLEQLVDTAAV